MPGVQINGQLDVRWATILDGRSGKLLGSVIVPYDTKPEALQLPAWKRAEGLNMYIRNPLNPSFIDRHQFHGGIEDANLIKQADIKVLEGTIPAGSSTFTLPAGLFFREMIISAEDGGTVTMGYDEIDPENPPIGKELVDEINLVDGIPETIMVGKKFLADKIIYVTTENDLTYEIHAS